MRSIKVVLCLFFFSLSAVNAQTHYIQKNDISYYDAETDDAYISERCKLDIYYPENLKNVPVIVWFHGGGLTGGQKEIPHALKDKGFCIVGVNYRLSPQVKAEKSIEDAAASVAWVLKNIQKYNGDPNSVIISGHSAGGYLALMTVMKESLLENYGVNSQDIAGLVPFSGHTITHFTIRKEMGIPGEQPLIDEWAPLYFVRKDTPPILLITGDREMEMLGRYEENAYFYRMMKVNGNENINIYEMDGYGHSMTEPAFPLLVNFTKQLVASKN